MNDPKTADNMDVRTELIRRMHAGEMTLAEVQKELKRIQKAARRAGAPTMYGSQRHVKSA